MNYKWKLYKNNKRYENLNSYHPIIHKLLANLKLSDDQIENFLNPDLSLIPNANLLKDIDKACDTILKFKDTKTKVFIHGDFDADGIVATSILWDFLYRKLNINCAPIIPNRFTDGYGLSSNTLDQIVKSEAELVITVDCGTKDIEIIKKYKDIKFIITDHHSFPINEKGEIVIPQSNNLVAVVHPQHPGGKYPNKEICGANVSWKLICALNNKIGGKFDVMEYLSLVALATITDIMPLKAENRVIVKKGVENIKHNTNLGLNTLLQTISLDRSAIRTYHLGYIIGPNFNAAGRIDNALDAVRLLSTKDEKAATVLAQKINSLNQTRQALTEDLLKEAETKVNTKYKLISIAGEDWPEGIIGLIAGKLCEKYYRPVIVMSIDNKKKIIKGSARSIPKFDITTALASVSEYLERFGGHKQAAGFGVKFSKFDTFMHALQSIVENQLKDEDLIPELEIASILEPEDINLHLINTIEALEPFGNANPKPKFLLENFEILENKILGNGEKHYRLNINKNRVNITAIAFNKKELIGKIKVGDIVDIVGCPSVNRWNGKDYIQFEIIDLKIKN